MKQKIFFAPKRVDLKESVLVVKQHCQIADTPLSLALSMHTVHGLLRVFAVDAVIGVELEQVAHGASTCCVHVRLALQTNIP